MTRNDSRPSLWERFVNWETGDESVLDGEIEQSMDQAAPQEAGGEVYASAEKRADDHRTALVEEELAAACDIVSLHCAVTEETRNLVDAALLRRMKPTAYLINTARGDLVDNEALRQALLEGRIAGAGLDTLSPEPVPAGHPLTALPPEVHRKVVLAPHLGGITEASFRRAHAHMWRNVEHLAAGERPDNIVNGL